MRSFVGSVIGDRVVHDRVEVAACASTTPARDRASHAGTCWTFPLLAVGIVVVLVKNAQRSVSGEFVGGLLLAMATLTTVHQNGEGMHRYRQDTLVRAARLHRTLTFQRPR